MKNFVMSAALLAAASGAASADVVLDSSVALTTRATYTLGQTGYASQPATAGSYYSNVDTFSGSGVKNGGTAAVSGVRTTQMLADHVNTASGGGLLGVITFSVVNFNTVAVSARYRVRIYGDDGAGGGPGTLLGAVSFSAFSNAASSVQLYTSDFTSLAITVPSSFWIGAFFDNSGASGSTVAQMNNLGLALFDPPAIGTSENTDFLTTAPSSNLTNNPAGAIRTAPFTGLNANYGWEFAPAPGSLALIGFAGLAAARRRR